MPECVGERMCHCKGDATNLNTGGGEKTLKFEKVRGAWPPKSYSGAAPVSVCRFDRTR